eukprot:TRINITY_DN10913_c0_g1_i1.p1 TRINITY_DN10913_c0_g1~~TRINITY_DN10913_c0_g1_i1.p1  ORF type:complete len:264 (-),score=31.78 TRINITY_DN10913_c0_g1_i1:84-800(-)
MSNDYSYQNINHLLKTLRESRLQRTKGSRIKPVKFLKSCLYIHEEPELYSRAIVSNVEYTMCTHLEKRFSSSDLANKNVIQIDSGCGLVGLAMHFLGALNVVLAERQEYLLDLLKKNVMRNVVPEGKDGVDCRQFEWGNTEVNMGHKMFSFVIAIISFRDIDFDSVINSLVQLSGNGTTVILGYIRDAAGRNATEENFRKQLGYFFDLSTSRESIYEKNNQVIVILQAKRKAFSSFLL